MSPEKLHGAHMSYLGEFLKIQKAENLYRKSGMQNQEVDQCLHALRCSLLENTHASHEKSTLPILDSLAHGKLEVLQDEREMLEFMVFFGHQISRTRTFRDSVIKNQPRRTSGEVELAESIEHAWWFLSYMFGMNL